MGCAQAAAAGGTGAACLLTDSFASNFKRHSNVVLRFPRCGASIRSCTRPGVHWAQQDSKRSPKRGPKGSPGGRACARGLARIFNFCSTYLLILNIWIEAIAHFLCTPQKYGLFSWFYVEKPDMQIRAILFFVPGWTFWTPCKRCISGTTVEIGKRNDPVATNPSFAARCG